MNRHIWWFAKIEPLSQNHQLCKLFISQEFKMENEVTEGVHEIPHSCYLLLLLLGLLPRKVVWVTTSGPAFDKSEALFIATPKFSNSERVMIFV